MSKPLPFRGLKQLAQHQRDACAKQLAAHQSALSHLEAQRDLLNTRRAALDEARRRSSRGVLDMQQLVATERIQSALRDQSAELDREIASMQGLLQASRNALLAAQQSLKSLVVLQDKHRAAEKRIGEAREQHALDEWSHHAARHTPPHAR